jgi:hypothetical protein
MKKRYLFVATFLFLIAAVFARPDEENFYSPDFYGAVEGYISDAATGWGIGAIPLFDTQTDTGGYFFADSLNPGIYGVTLEAAGFQTIVATIEVQANDTTTINVALYPIGEPLDIVLTETDGDEWRLRTYRDTSWNHYQIPLGRFRGTGVNFLDTPVFQLSIEPIGGGGLNTLEIADWIDNIFLKNILMDDFEDLDISDWEIIVALNGSYLETEFIISPILTNTVSLKLRHGNLMGGAFAGRMTKTFNMWIPLTPQDTLSFMLGGTPPYPLVGIAEPYSVIAEGVVLEQNYPNPFNPLTNLGFRIADLGFVNLEIFDVTGRKTATLVKKELPPGEYEILWDGRDETGREVGSGVYIYRLKSGNFTQSRKMLLLR